MKVKVTIELYVDDLVPRDAGTDEDRQLRLAHLRQGLLWGAAYGFSMPAGFCTPSFAAVRAEEVETSL